MKMVSALEHYESLIDEGNDPAQDPPIGQAYMSQWDGPIFFDGLNGNDKRILEIGIGTGRVAKSVLGLGCWFLTGIDTSPKTLARADLNLRNFSNKELVLADICEFVRPNTFDAAYSVLTFLHIEDKEQALNNIYTSLLPNGTFLLSVSKDEEWFYFNDRRIKLYPADVDEYIRLFNKTGFHIEWVKETKSRTATLIHAIKK
ncbi:methyltransferase domain-containing protein [Paenibacillus sp. FSL R10-2734]|uniref:class I SAM-dependent DNA methyltransferase n=1 Tax=Paenibacillus sp. FSL R10-2734 TaxID=2954691 RepID=UPI0030DDC7BC